MTTVDDTVIQKLLAYWRGEEPADLVERNRCRRLADKLRARLRPPSRNEGAKVRTALQELAAIDSDAAELIRALTPPAPPRPRQRPPQPSLALTLRFLRDEAAVLWESDVLGPRRSSFQPPFEAEALPLVLRALEAEQHGTPGREAFSPFEQEELVRLRLWHGEGLVPSVSQRVGWQLYLELELPREGENTLRTARDLATAQGQTLELRLRFGKDMAHLAALPWEALWDGEGPLLLSRGKLASCVRYLDLAEAVAPPRPTAGRLHMLAVLPSAGLTPEEQTAERAAREPAWRALEQSGAASVTTFKPATVRALREAIQQGPPVDLLHFYGQGRYHNGQGELLFDSPDGGAAWLSAGRFQALLGGKVRLVVLHASQSAQVGSARLLSGMASALSAASVLAVVAMQLSLPMAASALFAETLYQELARGVCLQEAVATARQTLYVEDARGASWYVPTLTIRSRDSAPIYLVR